MGLLVSAAFKVVLLELAMSSIFFFFGCLFWVVILECITSGTDSMQFKFRLLDQAGVPPLYK